MTTQAHSPLFMSSPRSEAKDLGNGIMPHTTGV